MQKTINKKTVRLEDIINERDLPDVIQKLKQSEEEIERGEGIPAEVAFRKLREKYGY